jgi:hypothetical protein
MRESQLGKGETLLAKVENFARKTFGASYNEDKFVGFF